MKALKMIELHAHISGCVRQASVDALLESEGRETKALLLPEVKEYSHERWFDQGLMEVFSVVGAVSSSPERIKRLFAEVIDDFALDGVVYVEFRIGLKGHNHEAKIRFCQALIDVIEEKSRSVPGMIVRLLVSVARHGEVSQGRENIEVAKHFFSLRKNDPIVVGVELGGNPYFGRWRDFQPLFEDARVAGLKVSLHCGENIDIQDEWREMIDFHPDRLGHCTFWRRRFQSNSV
jgi:adenosine deaminase